ncbi:MAG: hypothetical protein IPQ09_00070 [Myxococcales bacterium]|nr:hypothetical protein [Myxococcales bacterium]
MARLGTFILCGAALSFPWLSSACTSEVIVEGPGAPTPPASSAPPKAPMLGKGDGSPGSVTLTEIANADAGLKDPTDLDWNPMKPTELWVVNRGDDSIVTVSEAPTDARATVRRRDPAAVHFMPNPTGIAFGGNETTFGVPGTFAACGESRNERANGSANDFMGPALWSSDPTIFAKKDPIGLGSHLDMLHNTPLCMGITHETANRYWVTGGFNKSIDLYDFKRDHNVGQDDHSDGESFQYARGELGYVEGVPSHLAYKVDTKMVYVADTGNKRILSLDAKTGTEAKKVRAKEKMAVAVEMDGATLADVVPATFGLQEPSGITLNADILYVTDHATSRIHAFSLDGKELQRLDTGLAPGSLGGIRVGPDKKIYIVDRVESRVLRIDPK